MFFYYLPKSSSQLALKYFLPLNFGLRKMSASLTDNFEDAKKKLSTLKEEPNNEIKLKIYALFKQATIGSCNSPNPGAFNFVAKAKWDAWKSLGSLSQDDAKKNYVSLVNELTKTNAPTKENISTNVRKYDGFTYAVENGITKITFTRPEKKNALTIQMYKDIPFALKEASENDSFVTVITGEGDYFCSGNDLSNFKSIEGDINTMAIKAADMLKSFVGAFIDFPKPLAAAVNGPAIGLSVTLLGLFDIIYASDKATFHTPFGSLGQSPEGCSTYTFPKIMGYAKANEILLSNKKLTANEAMEVGLVTDVFSHGSFQQEVETRLSALSHLSKNSLIYSKKLMRDIEKDILHKVNKAECERLIERWQSPDCMKAIMDFFQKKGKL